MSWLYLAILGFTVAPAVLQSKDLLHPLRIYISIYSLLLAIYSLELSRIQIPWAVSTHMLFWGANGLFVAGGVIVYLADRVRFPHFRFQFGTIREALKGDALSVDWDWFYKVFWINAVFFLVAFSIAASLVGIPMLANDPDKVRLKFFSANMLANYGIFCGPFAMMLGTEYLLFSRPNRKRFWWVMSVTLILFLVYMTIVTRYDVFRVFLFGIVLYHYGKQRLGFMHLTSGLVVLLVIFMIGFFLRVNTNSIDAFNQIIQVKMPKGLAWASNFYAYLANDFWNFDYAIRKFEDGVSHYPMQWGFSLFRSALNQLFLEGPLIQSYGFDTIFNESIERIKGLNTIVYMWHFYKDFGAFGVYFITFAASILLGLFYHNTIRRPTVLGIAIWGLLLPALLLSYHAALWEMWFFYLNIAVLFIAHRRLGLA